MQIVKTHPALPRLKAISAPTLMSTPGTTNALKFITCKPWMKLLKRLRICMPQLSIKAPLASTRYCKPPSNTKVSLSTF